MNNTNYEIKGSNVIEVITTSNTQERIVSSSTIQNKIRKTEQYLANLHKRLEIINKLEVEKNGNT